MNYGELIGFTVLFAIIIAGHHDKNKDFPENGFKQTGLYEGKAKLEGPTGVVGPTGVEGEIGSTEPIFPLNWIKKKVINWFNN